MTQAHVNRLRKQLLDTGGIIPKSSETSRPRVSKSAWAEKVTDDSDPRKTREMKMIEAAWGQSIEQLLSADQKGVDVARKIGVTPACVSRWRDRLGIVVSLRRQLRNDQRERPEQS